MGSPVGPGGRLVLGKTFRPPSGLVRRSPGHHPGTCPDFFFASHALSEELRNDAYAVYACCRSIDDAVDRAAARGETVRPEVAGEILVRAFEAGGDLSGEEWMPAFRDTVVRKKSGVGG